MVGHETNLELVQNRPETAINRLLWASTKEIYYQWANLLEDVYGPFPDLLQADIDKEGDFILPSAVNERFAHRETIAFQLKKFIGIPTQGE